MKEKFSLFLGLGSNFYHRLEYLNEATEKLNATIGSLEEKGPILLTSPVFDVNQPYFFNQILHYKTNIEDPLAILKMTQNIEKSMGRKKTRFKGPRNIDIDIIFFGFKKFSHKELEIPHLAWEQRPFVKIPLIKMAPEFVEFFSTHKKMEDDFCIPINHTE